MTTTKTKRTSTEKKPAKKPSKKKTMPDLPSLPVAVCRNGTVVAVVQLRDPRHRYCQGIEDRWQGDKSVLAVPCGGALQPPELPPLRYGIYTNDGMLRSTGEIADPRDFFCRKYNEISEGESFALPIDAKAKGGGA